MFNVDCTAQPVPSPWFELRPTPDPPRVRHPSPFGASTDPHGYSGSPQHRGDSWHPGQETLEERNKTLPGGRASASCRQGCCRYPSLPWLQFWGQSCPFEMIKLSLQAFVLCFVLFPKGLLVIVPSAGLPQNPGPPLWITGAPLGAGTPGTPSPGHKAPGNAQPAGGAGSRDRQRQMPPKVRAGVHPCRESGRPDRRRLGAVG